MHMSIYQWVAVLSCSLILCQGGRLSEPERVQQWKERYQKWPVYWQNQTEAFIENLYGVRMKELQRIPGRNERWENYVQYIQSLMVPRFTEMGFEVIKIPDDLYKTLRAKFDSARESWDSVREERLLDAVHTVSPSKFVDLPNIQQIMTDLQHLHEEWSGLKLKGTSVYGIRSYTRDAALAFHYDKINTHVISSIVHIAHKYDDDNEPWPIEIEDHNGVLHQVSLAEGEMLFYESASCLHGRSKKFKGDYYASVFVHYQPVDKTIWEYSVEDVINNVPPFWSEGCVEATGSRWAGSTITVDSRITENAPPRIIKGEVVDNIEEYYSNLEL